jgi:hypothetical protein
MKTKTTLSLAIVVTADKRGTETPYAHSYTTF